MLGASAHGSSSSGLVERVCFLGRGAAGKSTAALELGRRTGLPVIELDERFWRPGLAPTPAHEGVRVQGELAAADQWIMDGDLGPYDVLAPRLGRADAVIVLDFSLMRCAWRAVRRSRERADFWKWLLMWRRRSRPIVLDAVQRCAPDAEIHVLRTPRELRQFLTTIVSRPR